LFLAVTSAPTMTVSIKKEAWVCNYIRSWGIARHPRIQISLAHAFGVSVSLIIPVCVSNWRFSTTRIKA